MGVRRGSVSIIVSDLLQSGLVVEGAAGKTVRGRKPTFLYIDSRRPHRRRGRRSRQPDLSHAGGSPRQAAQRCRRVPDRSRSEGAGRDAWCPNSRAARRSRGRRRLRGRRRGDSRDDSGARDDARAACPDVGVAERRRARSADVGDRPAGADRELRPGVRPGATLATHGARRPQLATSCSSACRTGSVWESSSVGSCSGAGTTWRGSSAMCR